MQTERKKKMAKKRKNSNYVTEKTIQKEKDKQRAIEVQRNKKIASWILIIMSILISLTVIIVALGAANGWGEKNLVVTMEADIEIEGYGTITLSLYGENAPHAVARFVSLARANYYDGKTFNSFLDDMLSATCTNNGSYIPMELDNGVHHRKGTISMVNMDGKGASTSFFITSKNQAKLNDTCTAFGRISEGYEVFEAICDYMESQDQSQGSVAYDKQPIITNITIRSVSN